MDIIKPFLKDDLTNSNMLFVLQRVGHCFCLRQKQRLALRVIARRMIRFGQRFAEGKDLPRAKSMPDS
jgi:hypothetical protein